MGSENSAASETLDDPGHQPLGGELLEVLLAVLREVAAAGREGRTGPERFLGRPLQLQPPVQLALADLRADRPHPEPPSLAAGIGLRDREQQRRVPIAALDRDCGPWLPRRGAGRAPARLRVLPDPSVDVLSLVRFGKLLPLLALGQRIDPAVGEQPAGVGKAVERRLGIVRPVQLEIGLAQIFERAAVVGIQGRERTLLLTAALGAALFGFAVRVSLLPALSPELLIGPLFAKVRRVL
jgi:hypothetical protein